MLTVETRDGDSEIYNCRYALIGIGVITTPAVITSSILAELIKNE